MGRKRHLPISHGLWARDITKNIPRNTRRHIRRFIDALLDDIGDPSNREKTLIVLTVPLIISCYRYGLELLTGAPVGSRLHYLAEMGRIERNLSAVGLKKRTIQKITNLEDYIQSKKSKEGNTHG